MVLYHSRQTKKKVSDDYVLLIKISMYYENKLKEIKQDKAKVMEHCTIEMVNCKAI